MTSVGPKRWFFDAWSWIYDAVWVQRSTYRPVHDAVVETLRGTRPGHILDLGCGTGQLTARLAARYPRARVVGCDFSAGMLERAAARSRSVHLVRGDAGRLPFADGSFDVVVSTEAFHWFPDQPAALAECRRVMRPGGRLLIATVNMPTAALSTLVHLGSRLAGEPFYWPSGQQAVEWIEAAGFRIDGRERITRLGGPLFAAVLTSALKPPAAGAGKRAASRSRWPSHRGRLQAAAMGTSG